MAKASQRGRLNQRKGQYHECKNGKKLDKLTGFTFARNLEQHRFADHLDDLLCTNAKLPFLIENKYRSKGNGILAEAWDQACRTVRKTGQWPSVIYQNGRLAIRAHFHMAAIAAAQGGLSSLVGTADLSLEDFAGLALRLIRII